MAAKHRKDERFRNLENNEERRIYGDGDQEVKQKHKNKAKQKVP